MTVRNAYTRDIRAPTHHHLEWNIRSEFIETSTTEIHKPFQAGISNILLVSPLSCPVRRNPDCIFLSGRVYISDILYLHLVLQSFSRTVFHLGWDYEMFQKSSPLKDTDSYCFSALQWMSRKTPTTADYYCL